MAERFFPRERLLDFCTAVAMAHGVPADQAVLLSDSLVFAQSRGMASHGLLRLSHYMEKLRCGLLRLDAAMPFTMEQGAVARLDAENGLGQVAGRRAMAKAEALAAQYGIGQVSVAHSNHFGTGAWYTLPPAERGFIALCLSNASPAMPPYGAKEPLLGTNPVGLAVPAGREGPIVLDMALSLAARGKIRLAAANGESIPLGWGVDAGGQPTADPDAVLHGGALSPAGGAKGSGLAFLVDLLCGALSGTGVTGQVRGITDNDGVSETAQLFLCVDVSKFLPLPAFTALVDASVERVRALTPVDDAAGILLPGEPERRAAARAAARGVAVDESVVDALNALARRTGCPLL